MKMTIRHRSSIVTTTATILISLLVQELYYSNTISFSTMSALALQPPSIAIKVCQNKHCCKRAAKNVDVLQTVNNLLPIQSIDNDDDNNSNIQVESSSCLSHCDMGPNVEITLQNGTSILLHGMESAQACAIQLTNLASEISEVEDAIQSTSDNHLLLCPPKILIAASKVIEQSQQFPNLQEKIRYLTSVINKLESSPSQPPVDQSPANAYAHALRAQAYLESSCYDDAINDARRVVQTYGKVATPSSLTLAYRTWADAEQDKARSNKTKDYSQAIAVLQEWFRIQPGFRTKIQQEIESLSTTMKR